MWKTISCTMHDRGNGLDYVFNTSMNDPERIRETFLRFLMRNFKDYLNDGKLYAAHGNVTVYVYENDSIMEVATIVGTCAEYDIDLEFVYEFKNQTPVAQSFWR